MIVADRIADPRDVARHYDELDTFYRSLWGEHLHHGYWRTGSESVEEAVSGLVRTVAERARVGTGSIVSDVGAGYGAPARLLAREYGAHVTAFTLSPVQHEHALQRSRAEPRVTHVLGDWLEQPPGEPANDAVIAIESTEHMRDKARFFDRCSAALVPGGRLVVCAWLADGSAGPRARRWLLEPICSEGRLPSMGTTDDYVAWIAAAGLDLVDVDDVTRSVARTWSISCRRMMGRLLVQPSAWAWLLDSSHENRVFALTVLRILAAYRTGAMRYAIITAERPAPAASV